MLLRREGWKVNAKRVYRLYREEGLAGANGQAKQTRRTCAGSAAGGDATESALEYGFCERPFGGRALVPDFDRVDQYTRECLVPHADRSQTGEKVVEQHEASGGPAWRAGVDHYR